MCWYENLYGCLPNQNEKTGSLFRNVTHRTISVLYFVPDIMSIAGGKNMKKLT